MALTQIDRDSQIKPGTDFAWVTNSSTGTMQDTSVTASRAVATDANGLPVASSTTATELGFVHGVTSSIQTQLGTKFDTAGTGLTSTGTTVSLVSPVVVANGGTGLTSLTAHGVLLGEGTSNVAFASPGTTAYPLVSNGASSDPSFQQLSLTAGVVGILPVVNGGTNSNATLSNGFVIVSSGGKLIEANGSDYSMNNGKVTNVKDPTSAQDAATKNYVDMSINGLTWKAPVAAATTAVLSFAPAYSNGTAGVGATLTATSNGALVIDGYTVLLNDRVLVQNQASAFQNGIYTQTTLGTGSVEYVLTRATDSNTPTGLEAGTAAFATNGTVNGDKGFLQTATVTTIGTSSVTYITFTSAVSAYFAGNGLDLTGSTFSISTDNSLTANAGGSSPSLTVKEDPARAITTVTAGIGVNVDNSTIDISGNAIEVKAGGITNTQVSASAGIIYSKLSLTNSIVNSDIASGAAIAFSKLAALPSADILVGNGSNVATAVAVTGDVSISNTGVTSISSGLSTHFVTREVPSGTINGSNAVFSLANTPVTGTECVYLNGLLQQSGGADYAISSSTITFTVAPETGSIILVNYQK